MFERIKTQITSIPTWRLIVYVCLIIFVIAYVIWMFIQPKKQSAESFKQPQQAVEVAKVPGPTLTVPIQIVPKKKVVHEFPESQIADDEEYVDTAEITPTDNGGVTLTSIDTVTGIVHTEFKPNKAPWFVFEGKNYGGVGVEVSKHGPTGSLYYKRDIVRVKDLHLQIKPVEVVIPLGGVSLKEVDVKAGANLEFRW